MTGFALGLSVLIFLRLLNVFCLMAGGATFFLQRTHFFKGMGGVFKTAGQNENEKIN